MPLAGESYKTLSSATSVTSELHESASNRSLAMDEMAKGMSGGEHSKLETSTATCMDDSVGGDFDDSALDRISPFVMPSGEQSMLDKVQYFASWPILLALYLTVPSSRRAKWRSFYMLTFVMSLVWLSIFSYVMVWMITIIGYTFLIPDTIMGITFIAFGASVPDALSSVIVAKKGHGNMAVSNAIGRYTLTQTGFQSYERS